MCMCSELCCAVLHLVESGCMDYEVLFGNVSSRHISVMYFITGGRRDKEVQMVEAGMVAPTR